MRWITALVGGLRALMFAAFATSGAPHAQQAPSDADESAWAAARSVGTAEAYQRYLEEFPVGRHAEDAFRFLVEESIDDGGGSRGLSVDLY